MTPSIDEPTAIRPGEELDLPALGDYLRRQRPELTGPLSVQQFPSGHSNLTYLVTCGPAEFVLRRPPFGNQVQSAHDMGREFRVLSKLCQVYPAAPRPLVYCEDPAVIGAPFYVMERRRGFILRKSLPASLATPETARRLSEALIDKLAELHAVDYESAGLSDLGKPQGYVERQVRGWTQRYAQAKTDELAVMDRVADWLHGNLPPASAATLIHNDFKFDNLVFDAADPTRVIAVLDWEMATLGDPGMDLGTTLGYWVEATDPEPLRHAAMGPTAAPGSLTRQALMDRYEESTGREIGNRLFYYVFGLFKIAVIIQQIYARHARGLTQDPRFARLNQLVAILAQQADRSLQEL